MLKAGRRWRIQELAELKYFVTMLTMSLFWHGIMTNYSCVSEYLPLVSVCFLTLPTPHVSVSPSLVWRGSSRVLLLLSHCVERTPRPLTGAGSSDTGLS
jgi:hypothetical protein